MKIKKTVILFLLMITFSSMVNRLCAQSDNGIITLNSNKGLSNNIITSIAQDDQGFIWIGTEHGLNKYNGYNLTVYPHMPDVATSLTGNKINDLLIDSKGNLWVTTAYDGVSLYDIEHDQFKNFQNSSNDITTLSLNLVNTIAEDINNKIWIGTYFGLNSIDSTQSHVRRHFTNFSINITDEILDCLGKNQIPDDIIAILKSYNKKEFVNLQDLKAHLISEMGFEKFSTYEERLFCWGILAFSDESQYDEKIMSIAPDKDGNLWLALFENGMVYFNTKNKTYRFYTTNGKNSQNSLAANDVNTLYLTNNILWIGGTSGWIDKYDLKKREITHMKLSPENTIFKIKKWNNDEVFFITEHGLFMYDAEKDTILNQQASINKIFKEENINKAKDLFKDKTITALFKDNHKNLWFGTKKGIFCIEKSKEFSTLIHDEEDKNSIYWGDVSSLSTDSSHLYIGYINSTFDVLNFKDSLLDRYNYFENNPYNLGQGSIQAIEVDNKNRIIIGTFGGGAQFYDPINKTFNTIKLDNKDVNHLGNHDVRSVVSDSEGKIWIALHGGGLSCYNPETKELKRYMADYSNWRTSLHENWLISLYCDARDNIWIGSYSGLSIFNQQTQTFRSYKASSDNKSITNNTVNGFHESLDGTVWIATNAGLDKYSPRDSSFTYIPISLKQFKLSIFSILEDKQRNLWLGTNKGIVRYGIDSANIKVFSTRDGLHDNEFFIGANDQTETGRMYFGGKNGITYFHPDSISNNLFSPPVVLTGLKLFYKDIKVNDTTQTILKKNISVANEIVLNYHQNIITFEYAALNYIHTEMNEYRYTLEGFDEKWHEVGRKREATYTSLNPGEYTFKVIASNNDGIWNNEGASIKVVVLPPWWQTWWFRAIVLICFVGTIVGFFYLKSYQLKMQNKVLEQKVQIRTEEISVANQEIMSQNEQISSQRDALEKQNRMITQSIASGQRIQSALLPSDAVLQSYFDDYFVIYSPRDIVSGDFYWAHWVGKYLFVIASDCTGHGIPGAFMSMLGNAMLNEIIIKSKIHDPAQILTELNKSVQDTFKKTQDGPDSVDEGMDITVAAIDTERNKLLIASALQPYYITVNDVVQSVSGDMFSIGEVFARIKEPEFNTHVYDIVPGMCLYIGSDGIVDQFSSSTKKKFNAKRLINTLQENIGLSMQGQAWSVEQAYEEWKGDEPQLDDIMLLGLRF